MKKIVSIAAFLLMLSTASFAQNNTGNGLAGILGKVAGAISGTDTTSNAVNDILTTITGIIKNNDLTEDKIPGKWNYKGSAVSFKSENALSNVASTVAEGTIEKKLDEYLAKVGITDGKFGFTFNSDSTMTLNYGGKSFNGTWSYDAENAQVRIKIAKLINVKGYITVTNGTMKLLFSSNAMLKIIKAVTAQSKNASIQAISSVLKSYNQMYAGFKLTK